MRSAPVEKPLAPALVAAGWCQGEPPLDPVTEPRYYLILQELCGNLHVRLFRCFPMSAVDPSWKGQLGDHMLYMDSYGGNSAYNRSGTEGMVVAHADPTGEAFLTALEAVKASIRPL